MPSSITIAVTAEQLAYLEKQARRASLTTEEWCAWKIFPPALCQIEPTFNTLDSIMADNTPDPPEVIPGRAKAAIFEMLEHIKKRPAMYLGRHDDVHGLDLFLNGFGGSFHAFGARHSYLHLYAAMRAHNYETSARVDYLYEQMRERGLSDAEIVQERMMLEIEAWGIHFAEADLGDKHKQVVIDDSIPLGE
ncbi:MAG: hypothetical protein ABIY70_25595 [Capsulimonas sp.]|uniref:hypothetical protein n=1 Tax=Capsulimonas sp. TaxID=2494211 RepID=UPI00326652FC